MTLDSQCARTEANKKAWLELQSMSHDQHSSPVTNGYNLTNQVADAGDQVVSAPMKEDNMAIFNCLSRALRWCSAGRDISLPPPSPELNCSTTTTTVASHPLGEVSRASHIQILVTGSLHLVGAAMNTLGCSVDDL